MRRSRRYVRHSVFMPMDRGHLEKRENTPTYRSRGDRLAGPETKSALNLEVLSRSFAPVRDFLVFDDLPLIETAEAGSFDRRDVDEHIFTAAALRLDEPIALGRIEPLHGAFRHYLLQATSRRAKIIARPKRKGAPKGAGELEDYARHA